MVERRWLLFDSAMERVYDKLELAIQECLVVVVDCWKW